MKNKDIVLEFLNKCLNKKIGSNLYEVDLLITTTIINSVYYSKTLKDWIIYSDQNYTLTYNDGFENWYIVDIKQYTEQEYRNIKESHAILRAQNKDYLGDCVDIFTGTNINIESSDYKKRIMKHKPVRYNYD